DDAIELNIGRDLLAVDRGDPIVFSQSGPGSRSSALGANDHHSLGISRQLVETAKIGVHVPGLDAQIAPRHTAPVDKLGKYCLECIDWYRKAQPLRALEHKRVDANYLSLRVDQRAAGVSGVYRGIRLQEVIELPAKSGSTLGADDAQRNRVVKPERVSDGDNPIAHAQRVAVADLGHWEGRPAWNDLQQRDVGSFIVTFDRSRELTTVVQCDRHAVDQFGRGSLIPGSRRATAAQLGVRDQMKVRCDQ